ncbi:MAG: MXAN_6577-like cysteine-rich protein [Sandaracinaceae bacterium]
MGTEVCDGRCVDVDVDPSNCGACGASCEDGEVCSAGACADGCGAGTVECEGACADTDVDPSNCGGCGMACAIGSACVDGACAIACSAGLTDCSGACVDTDLDPSNCGACGMGCPDGEVCSAGACATSCGAGTELCDGACADTSLDRDHCGTCGEACAADEVCSGGLCGDFCGAGTELCGEACADTENDRRNCGTCGMACGAEEACVEGGCQPLCPADQTACDGACVDTSSDVAHCGTCGMACTMSEVCRDSGCDTARAVAVVTTVSRNEQLANDAWLVYEGAPDTPRRLNPTRFETNTVQSAQLTANGDVVVFAAQDTEGLYELYVARATTTGLTKLNAALPSTVGVQHWALSPDQTRLVYVTTDPGGGSARVFTVSLDMPGVVSARDEVLRATADAITAEVTDDGGVFVHGETAGGFELYFVAPSSTTPMEISAATDDLMENYVVSADGQRVVFDMLEDGATFDLFVGARDGSRTRLSLADGTSVNGFVVSDGDAALYAADDNVLVVFSLSDPSVQTRLAASERFDGLSDIFLTPAGDRVVFAAEADDDFRVYAIDVAAPDEARRLSGSLERRRYVSAVGLSGDGSTLAAQYESVLPRMTVAPTDGSAAVIEPDIITGATVYTTGDIALTEDGNYGFFPLFLEDENVRALYATPLPEAEWVRVDLALRHDSPSLTQLSATPSASCAAFVGSIDDPHTGELYGFVPGAKDRAVRLSAPISAGTSVRDFALREAGDVVVYLADTGGAAQFNVFATTVSSPGVATQLNPSLGGAGAREVWIDGDDVYYTVDSAASGDDLYRASLGSPGAHSLVMTGVRELAIHEGDVFLVHYDEATGVSQLSVVRGSVTTKLSADGVAVRRFVVSADTQHLYYQEDDSPYALWHLDLAAGGAALRMTSADHLVSSSRGFATSADGARLVYIGSARTAGIDEVWMVELASPEVEVQLNANFNSTNRDAWEVQITAAGDYVVFRADVVSGRDELFGVDPANPQTSQVRLHQASDSTAEDVFSGWVLTDDRVLFRADFVSNRFVLYGVDFAAPETEVALSLDTSQADVDAFVVAGARLL